MRRHGRCTGSRSISQWTKTTRAGPIIRTTSPNSQANNCFSPQITSLRLGPSYGPGLRPNSVFRIFIDRAKQGEPITIQGDGSQGRQFTHTSDVAGAFSLACRSDIRGTTVNIVAPDLVSIRELAELVVARYPTDLRFGEPRPGDVPPALVSAERARSLLGWKAEMPFSRGLDDLMDELEEHG